MTHPLTLSTDELEVFFDEGHHALASELRDKLAAGLDDRDSAALARGMGAGLRLYRYLIPEAHGGAPSGKPGDATFIDVRKLVLIREALGQASPHADSIFAVQGLGSYPIVLGGTDAQRARYLPDVLSGARVGSFGLTEPEAGSDVASLRTTARRDGDTWIIDGEKTLISNAPIADHCVVFANADPASGRKGISAFVVEMSSPGLHISPIAMSVAHPIGALRFEGCRVPADAILGGVGAGFSLAMATLDAFRISVGAAANGMASRALSETVARVTSRKQFGARLSDQQIVKAYVAEMATELDASRLLVARAAHKRDTRGGRVSLEAAMGKMYATEAAQRIIDRAVQLHGGHGVALGTVVERLYREIRPLRIYEGTTEIQKLIIAKALFDRAPTGPSSH